MYNLQSDCILRKSFFYMNTQTEMSAPLNCCVIDYLLLKAMPQCQSVHVMNFSEAVVRKFCSSLGSNLAVGTTGLMK